MVDDLDKMLTKDNWFNTTLDQRAANKSCDFKVITNPYYFKNLNFDTAADYTCEEIYKKYKNLYLALSGGADSEFVLKCFYRNNIPIKPVIVKCGNPWEIQYAFKICDFLKLNPIVIEISEDALVDFYIEHILNKFDGVGYNSTQNLIASSYVSQFNEAKIISGNHCISDGNTLINDKEYFFAYELDFYTDYFLNNCNNINFFIYTIEILYAMAPRCYESWGKYKHRIYDIKMRNKIRHSYSHNTQLRFYQLVKTINPKVTGEIWSKEKFYSYFNNYKEN